MSTCETSPEIASMAGRILAAGNPLDNDQVILAVIEALADANTGRAAQAALRTMFQPYFENMLSLAGSCLAQTENDDSDGLPRIAITATVDWSKITNAIIGAFESSGSTYWLRESEYVYTPDGVEGNPLYAEDQFWAKGGKVKLSYDDLRNEEQRATKEVGLLEIKAGLRSMAEEDPRHFGDLVSENDDATTHDVFIQHVLFNEVIYG
jgi:hypothetical protein